MKPFVKWAGGKTQLLPEIHRRYVYSKKYCEPFLGGGAVLFDLLKPSLVSGFKEIYAGDINAPLIGCYKNIQRNASLLIKELSRFSDAYFNASDSEKYFYEMRLEYNTLKKQDSNSIIVSALFIFLNKTCFNGLYRVNKNDEFNVPFGKYKTPLICDDNNILELSKAIQNVSFFNEDYYSSIDFIDSSTFVYLDPPYRPVSKTASFTSYSENSFKDRDQIRLSNFISDATKKGAKVLLSNSDTGDGFFEELYKNYKIEKVTARRSINSNSSGRGQINELLIINF